jgi:predicted DNA-binding ribbon-helix-helix protein
MTVQPERAAAVRKHSLMISGHPTSVSLEDAFWTAFKGAAKRKGLSVAALAAEIDAQRGAANLSSAIRVFLLEAAQGRA